MDTNQTPQQIIASALELPADQRSVVLNAINASLIDANLGRLLVREGGSLMRTQSHRKTPESSAFTAASIRSMRRRDQSDDSVNEPKTRLGALRRLRDLDELEFRSQDTLQARFSSPRSVSRPWPGAV